MISQDQISILQIISRKLLVKKSELSSIPGFRENGSLDSAIQSLKGNGLIDILTPMGETSFAITQKGIRLLSEKNGL